MRKMTSMSDAHERWSQAIEDVQRFLEPIKKVLEDSKLRQLVEAWPRIAERFKTLSETVRDACARAALPPFRLMDVDEWNEIERVSQAEGAQAASDLVERLSREALAKPEVRQELVRDWRANPVAATRADILEQALKAHELGLYAVSIPPFLAHVEGVITDSKHSPDAEDSPRFWMLKKYVSELAETDEHMGRFISEYVTETLYQDFVRKKEAPLLSRHAVLHGFDTGYASETNSVRAILIFDCVQDLALEHSNASKSDA